MSSQSERTYLRGAFAALALGIIFAVLCSQAMGDDTPSPVPRASCGSSDRTESGLQGQTTLAERFGAGPAKTYNCNLELISHVEGEGTAGFMAVFEKCAYYSTWHNPRLRHPGVTVLDVSDAQRPKPTTYLSSPGMLNANQSLAVSPVRKILLASPFNSTIFDIYDLSVDCRHPVLKSSVSVPRTASHLGGFAPDGQTYYGASCCFSSSATTDPAAPPSSAIFALDVSDPLNLRAIATWIPSDRSLKTHGVSVSRDGTRLYVSTYREEPYDNPNGLVILDASDIQARRPDAEFRVAGTLFWSDTWATESGLPVTIRGRQYVIFTDILGALGLKKRTSADACVSGRPAYGVARIIDITDEKNPSITSKLMLEVHDPANCPKVAHDPTTLFGYSSFFCNVDNDEDARMLACGYFEAGLRVFDIRDPVHPKEIAYYKPPAPRGRDYPGSVVRNLWPGPRDHTADQVWFPIFREKGEEIWFVSAANGFHVVRFPDRFKKMHGDLFQH